MLCQRVYRYEELPGVARDGDDGRVLLVLTLLRFPFELNRG